VLSEVKRQLGLPVLTDVHEDTPMAEVAAVVDVLQTPAFLCRQTNFILSAASQGKPVNIKKGQFPVALGDAQRHRQGALDGQPADHGVRARLSRSATTTWSPTCVRCP
jgi:3-deoxy-D-manno-octulosonic acid (KDO) 8-phosphate synthase